MRTDARPALRRARPAPPAACFFVMFACLAQAPMAPRVLAAATPGEPVHEHVLAHGDTLYSLAREHLVAARDWRDLQRLNAVREPRRLRPGSVVRIPLAWLRSSPAQAEVTFLQGAVTLERARTSVALERGIKVVAGDVITTGANAYLTLRLADGASVRVQEASRVEVTTLGVTVLARSAQTAIGLERGAVENAVPTSKRKSDRFEIRTPLGATAVRGTEFRAGYDGSARIARTEVLAGVVAVTPEGAGGRAALVEAGFGVAVTADGSARTVRLLPAPQLGSIAERHERLVLRLPFPAVEGARGYRVQLRALDGDAVIFNQVTQQPELRIADVPDGRYRIQVRAIDAAGLEGLDAQRDLVLKARPEPPFPSSPADGGRVRADVVELRWTGAQEASHYRLQVADNAQFRSPILDRSEVTATNLRVTVPEGTWYWRIASVRADGDVGPFSDPSRFERRPAPADPDPPGMDEKQLNIRWRGEPGQVFRLQVARDEAFTSIVIERSGLTVAQAILERPAPGIYFLRVQATDPDGFVGPYSSTQRIEVPEPPPPPPPWWLLLFLIIPLL